MRYSVAIFAWLVSLTLPVTANALTIRHVSHTPEYIEAGKGATVDLRFVIDEPAQVVIKLYDDREQLIRTIAAGSLAAGEHTLQWDLRDDKGHQVPPEAYHYVIEANGSERVVHDLSDLTGKDPIVLKNIKWDKKAGVINYLLPRHSRVNLRIGITGGGPLLHTLVNWVPRRYGPNSERWDGKLPGDGIDISSFENVKIFAEAFRLSKNTILVGPLEGSSNYVNTPDAEERVSKGSNKTKAIDYAAQNAGDRKEYKVKLDIPALGEENGVPMIRGAVPIRVKVADEDVSRLGQDRFEPILYVDGRFVTEVESGFYPFTWRISTKEFTEGEHIVTINLRGYSGQYGTASKKVYMKH